MPKLRTKKEVVNVAGRLEEITTVSDEKGKVLKRIMRPLMIKFHLKDMLQVIIGASILAIPVGYTEETWHLGDTLPLLNIMGFLILSLLFIGAFTYYHYYRNHMKNHGTEFVKRTFLTYIFAFIVVAVLLTLIQRTPWTTDFLLAFKRTVIVTLPASLSGTIADVIR